MTSSTNKANLHTTFSRYYVKTMELVFKFYKDRAHGCALCWFIQVYRALSVEPETWKGATEYLLNTWIEHYSGNLCKYNTKWSKNSDFKQLEKKRQNYYLHTMWLYTRIEKKMDLNKILELRANWLYRIQI